MNSATYNFIPHKLLPMLPAPHPRSATNLASLFLQHFINMHSSICSITYLASHNFISSSTPFTFLDASPPGQQEYLEIPGMGHGDEGSSRIMGLLHGYNGQGPLDQLGNPTLLDGGPWKESDPLRVTQLV